MTTTTKPTMYENLKAHLAKHMYRRGKHKGDAPADASNRGKNHYRVVQNNNRSDCISVRFHATDIITAHAGGTIVLHMGGYEDSPTTKAAYRHAMGAFSTFTSYLHSVTQFGLRQICVTTFRPIAGQKTYRYYSHMQFDAEGNLLTDPAPFQRRGIDKFKSKAFIQALKESEFRAVFPLLYATVEKPNKTELMNTRIPDAETLRFYLTTPDKASFWPTIVGRYKYHTYRTSVINIGGERTRAECWSAIMADAKRDMYKITNTDVTSI